jgi:rubrerythrin
MASLKGTRTEKNILTAFAGESQARNRYTFYASKAKDEGLIQISKIFEKTAEQEKEHAKRLYKLLEGGAVEVTATFPAGTIADTLTNLEHAAGGENYENQVMYPEFAKIAREEGLETIARVFEAIGKAEVFHERRYRALHKNLKEGKVFKKDGTVTWYCQNCGYIHESAEAPAACPACAHPQAHFEIAPENY